MSRKSLTKCVIKNGVLTISVGVELIAHAARIMPALSVVDTETLESVEPKITDVDKFAAEVLRQLEAESEDGTTAVHRMLDACIVEAIEYGAEGIELADDLIRARRKKASGGVNV